MKRLLALLITPLLLISSFLLFAPDVASAITPDAGGGTAQTQTQATECYKRYNGKTLTGSSRPNGSPVEQFNLSNCSEINNGNCTVSSTQGDNSTIACTKKAGVGPGSGGGSGSGVNNISDPAFGVATSCSKSGCGIVSNFINPAIIALNVLVGVAVVIGIIVGAIQVISSAGDPQQSVKGKNHIRNAIIALIAYMLLYFLIKFIIPGA